MPTFTPFECSSAAGIDISQHTTRSRQLKRFFPLSQGVHLQSALSMTKSTEVAVQMVSPASLAAASIIFYHFLLSGDVELNPGPTIFYGILVLCTLSSNPTALPSVQQLDIRQEGNTTSSTEMDEGLTSGNIINIFFGVLTFTLTIVGLILTTVGLSRSRHKGLAATGTILPPSSAPAPCISDELSDVKIHENGTTSVPPTGGGVQVSPVYRSTSSWCEEIKLLEEVPTDELSEDQLRKIKDKLKTHAPKWENIAQGLHFRASEIEIIRSMPQLFMGAPVSFLNQMLDEWYQWYPGDARESTTYATAGAIIEAVNKAGKLLIN